MNEVNNKLDKATGRIDEAINAVHGLWPLHQKLMRESFVRGFGAGVITCLLISLLIWIGKLWGLL